MPLLPYLEDLDSQVPTIQVLNALGWKYLSREVEADFVSAHLTWSSLR